MKPLHVGFTNPTHEPDSLNPNLRKRVRLEDDDFLTHIHGIGASRSGKSKWLEYFCRGLILQGVGFTLIDPQGKLSKDLMHFCSYAMPEHLEIVYFNPSRDDYLIPFNPFYGGLDDISVRVDRYVTSTLKVWGVDNEDETPRLGRWLRNVYYLFALGEITFNEVDTLLRFSDAGKNLRFTIAQKLATSYPTLAAELEELDSSRNTSEFLSQIESVRNRLVRFSDPPQFRRIMSHKEGNLNFKEVFDERKIVIADLQDSAKFSEQNAQVIGTLMINELWSAAKRHSDKPHDYFLLVDEVENFLTPDLRDILDRGAGKGLHLGVFHQHLTQLREKDQWTYDSVMGNAQIKIVFGGLTKENALLMGDELFAGQVDYEEVKYYLAQTKFWPVYERDQVYTRATSRGMGSNEGFGSGTNIGVNYFGDGMDVASNSAAESSSAFYGSSEFSGESEGMADVPIFRPVPYQELSSVTMYSLEEQRNRLADALKGQYQRHYFLRRPMADTIACVTPFVKDFRIFPKVHKAYVLEHYVKPYAMAIEVIDEKLEKQRYTRLGGRVDEETGEIIVRDETEAPLSDDEMIDDQFG